MCAFDQNSSVHASACSTLSKLFCTSHTAYAARRHATTQLERSHLQLDQLRHAAHAQQRQFCLYSPDRKRQESPHQEQHQSLRSVAIPWNCGASCTSHCFYLCEQTYQLSNRHINRQQTRELACTTSCVGKNAEPSSNIQHIVVHNKDFDL